MNRKRYKNLQKDYCMFCQIIFQVHVDLYIKCDTFPLLKYSPKYIKTIC